LAAEGDEWLTSHHGCLSLGKNPGTHSLECEVDFRAGLDIQEKRKISYPSWDVNPRASST